jgi:hypothetical protein
MIGVGWELALDPGPCRNGSRFRGEHRPPAGFLRGHMPPSRLRVSQPQFAWRRLHVMAAVVLKNLVRPPIPCSFLERFCH